MQAIWMQMRPMVFVIIAMLFGTVMTVLAKLLKTSNEEENPMSPVQVRFSKHGPNK